MKGKPFSRPLRGSSFALWRALALSGEKYLSMEDISQIFPIPRGNLRVKLHRLVKAGYLRRVRRGLYYVVPVPYEEENVEETVRAVFGNFEKTDVKGGTSVFYYTSLPRWKIAGLKRLGKKTWKGRFLDEEFILVLDGTSADQVDTLAKNTRSKNRREAEDS